MSEHRDNHYAGALGLLAVTAAVCLKAMKAVDEKLRKKEDGPVAQQEMKEKHE